MHPRERVRATVIFRATLAIVLAVVVSGPRASRADARNGIRPIAPGHASIHQLEVESWRTRAAAADEKYEDPRLLTIPPRAHRTAAVTHEVHGYHPYWMGSSYTSYDWSLITTVAFFSLELSATGAIVDDHGWPWTSLVANAHQNGVRVIVTATLFSSNDLSILLGSASNRSNAIANLVGAVVAGNADGVSIDFEGVPGSRKQQLVAFMSELRAALDATLPEPYLSIATPAVDWANAFDYDALAASADHLMIMAYDFHWSGSSTSGPVAPLDGWGAYNVNWTIQDYLTWGAPREKMLLGVPYYGYKWDTVSGDPGAATTSTGTALTYAAIADEVGAFESMWDGVSQTPWYRGGNPNWLQTWHEDASSLSSKYQRVIDENLAGVGVWALGYDGFYSDLWGALDSAFRASTSGVPSANPTGLAFGVAGPHPARGTIELRVQATQDVSGDVIVYDARGRRVRTLWRGTLSGSQVLRWDGFDDHGRPSPSGSYIARVRSAAGCRSARIVLLR